MENLIVSGSCAQADVARFHRCVQGEEMDLLTFLQILDDAQLLPEGRIADILSECGTRAHTKDVAGILLEREWLTSYQLDRILSGRAKELAIGQYRILSEIGRGSFGRVYKARHCLMDRIVALKVITPQLIEDGTVRARFLREVTAVTHLSHPNIVMAYDANEADDLLFLVMEYVDGPDLEREVELGGPMPIPLACAIIQQAARALQYAHEQGIVHRDIKPANLLRPRPSALIPSGAPVMNRLAGIGDSAGALVKVADFGLARLQTRGELPAGTIQIPKNYTTAGTPAYMSPEQALDIHITDIRSDLYSLGCTFYFALSGQCPFRGTTFSQIVSEQMDTGERPIEWFRPQIPPNLAGIVRRLMAKDPADRFQTPAQLVEELNYFHASQLKTALSPSRAPPSQLASGQEPQRPMPVEKCPVAAGSPSEMGPPLEEPASVRDASAQNANHSHSAIISSAPIARKPEGASLPSTTESLTLLDAWREWYSVVDRLYRTGHAGTDPQSYVSLHKVLCQAIALQLVSAVPEVRTLLLRLDALIEPWLSLPSLLALDRKTLAGLFQSCHLLNRELGCDKEKKGYATATFILAGIMAIVVLFAWLKLCMVLVLGPGPLYSADRLSLGDRGRLVSAFTPNVAPLIHHEKATA